MIVRHTPQGRTVPGAASPRRPGAQLRRRGEVRHSLQASGARRMTSIIAAPVGLLRCEVDSKNFRTQWSQAPPVRPRARLRVGGPAAP